VDWQRPSGVPIIEPLADRPDLVNALIGVYFATMDPVWKHLAHFRAQTLPIGLRNRTSSQRVKQHRSVQDRHERSLNLRIFPAEVRG